jgi:pimeloyl-ACP methyl ester carboxylesterase
MLIKKHFIMNVLRFSKSIFPVLWFAFIASNSLARELVSVKKFTRTEVDQNIIRKLNTDKAISALKITYSTTDINGDSTIASGLLLIPDDTDPENAPVAVFAHGSTTKRRYVPSELNFQADYAANLTINNYITIAPDYLGLGDSPGFHPYLHSETEATAILDMIRAVRNYFNDSLDTTIRKDLYLTGYSQGGHAVMAVHKYILENDLTDEFLVNASAPCSGPYSMSEVMHDYVLYLNEIAYCDPELIIHTILSCQYVYGNLYQETNDYFIAPYDSIIDSYLKNDCDFELNDYFPVQISVFIKDSILDNWQNNPDDHFTCDLRNYDVDNWRPGAPVRMYYSKADKKIPYENALKAEEKMNNNGAEDVKAIEVSTTLDHNQAMKPAMQLLLKWFNEMEYGPVSASDSRNIRNDGAISNFNISYSHNSSVMCFEYLLKKPCFTQIDIYSLSGQKINSILSEYQDAGNKTVSFPIHNFKKGIYVCSLKAGEYVFTRKIVK